MLKVVALVLTLAGVPVAAAASGGGINAVNLILNLVTIVGVVGGVFYFGPRAFQAKQAEADLRDKDRTIATQRQTIEANDRRIVDLETENKDLRDRNATYRAAAEAFQARYEEAAKYSGEEAFRVLEREAQRRHVELMGVLHALQETVGERRAANLVDPDEIAPLDADATP